jgi:hypothetical protein
MLLTRPSKNVYRQHRSKTDVTALNRDVRFVPTADIALQCPNEPNIIVAITFSETRKGEVEVSKFIPTHLICPRRGRRHSLRRARALTLCCGRLNPGNRN